MVSIKFCLLSSGIFSGIASKNHSDTLQTLLPQISLGSKSGSGTDSDIYNEKTPNTVTKTNNSDSSNHTWISGYTRSKNSVTEDLFQELQKVRNQHPELPHIRRNKNLDILAYIIGRRQYPVTDLEEKSKLLSVCDELKKVYPENFHYKSWELKDTNLGDSDSSIYELLSHDFIRSVGVGGYHEKFYVIVGMLTYKLPNGDEEFSFVDNEKRRYTHTEGSVSFRDVVEAKKRSRLNSR